MDGQFYRKERSRSRVRGFLKKFLKNRRAVIATIIVVPLLVGAFLGDRGIIQRLRLEQQRDEMRARIAAAEEETKRLQAELKALDGDLKAIERISREKYGMLRKGETVYRVKEE